MHLNFWHFYAENICLLLDKKEFESSWFWNLVQDVPFVALEEGGSSVSAHRFLPRQLLFSKNSFSGVTASVAKDPATPSRWSPSREHWTFVVQLPELFWNASRCPLIRRSLHFLSKPLGVMFELRVFNCIKMTFQVLSPAFMRDRFMNIFPSSQLVLSTLSWITEIEFSKSLCSLPRFCCMGKNSFRHALFLKNITLKLCEHIEHLRHVAKIDRRLVKSVQSCDLKLYQPFST